MRKILLISLSAIYLSGNTEITELFKFPHLIFHYFQHHRQDDRISFLEFLADHYGGDDGTSADDYQDSKLPYHNPNHHSFTSLFSGMNVASPSVELPENFQQTFVNRLFPHYPPGYGIMILQPPRFS